MTATSSGNARLLEEYRRVRSDGGLFDRSSRTLARVTGADRKTWLHNLCTNAVKTLDDGAGNYAFACDVRGRTLFDLNILARPEYLLLDVDAAAVDAAMAHLERHLIMEDVRLERLGDHAAIGVAGPRSADTAAALGVGNFTAQPQLASVELSPGEWFVRHDFAGLPGFELFAERERLAARREALLAMGFQPVGGEVLDVLRIEAGIPWFGRDIDDKVIPPETGQIERGVSYHKGCYLGQEVIERMRSHGSQARRLASFEVDAPSGLETPASLTSEGKDAGRITSLVWHPERGMWIGLGYLRTKLADYANLSAGDPPVSVRVRSRLDSVR